MQFLICVPFGMLTFDLVFEEKLIECPYDPMYLFLIVSSLKDRTFSANESPSFSSKSKVPQGFVNFPAVYNVYITDEPLLNDCLKPFCTDTACNQGTIVNLCFRISISMNLQHLRLKILTSTTKCTRH